MVDSSVGKILSQTRLAKRLTIDEVAHATKLRPDKIVALENDDFSRFGSLAYGKGFLQIYARYLGIDITQQLRGMEAANPVSIADYQYLNSTHEQIGTSKRGAARSSYSRETQGRRAPSIVPLVIVLGGLLLCGYVATRIFGPSVGAAMHAGSAVPTPIGEADATAPTGVSQVEASSTTPPVPQAPAPAREEVGAPPSPEPSRAQAATASAAAETQTPDSAFLAATPSADGSIPQRPTLIGSGQLAQPALMNELVVEPIRKTWVKIHKDGVENPPIFEDYLYPGVRPLKLRGSKFFVEVRDQGAVQIRKNGHLVAYQAPGISIP